MKKLDLYDGKPISPSTRETTREMGIAYRRERSLGGRRLHLPLKEGDIVMRSETNPHFIVLVRGVSPHSFDLSDKGFDHPLVY